MGAGASGLPAAITARDRGASVILIDANHDIGGHAMLSGGEVPLGGGTSLQKKYGVVDSADQVYLDHMNHKNSDFRYCDRDLVRMWADENAATFEFLIENDVKFNDEKPEMVNGGSVPRLFVAKVYSDDLAETINGRPGSGLVRPLEKSARAKSVEILLKHKMTRVIRENPTSGGVLGISATSESKTVNIRARKGVIIATGGHTSNVAFRRMFDPRLTEEYQVVAFLSARLGTNGDLGRDGKANGGGPIWAIFDFDAVVREKWDPKPPNVDLNGWFFSADTIADLAGKIKNPYQRRPIPAGVLEQTVSKYNGFVDAGKDSEFGKPGPMYKIQKPSFYAAWSTPILHDTLTGLKINTKCQVIDRNNQVIPGLYACGESAGGFALHGLPRVTVFGRVAGREAASANAS